MNAICTLKKTIMIKDGFNAYDGNNELMATVSPVKDSDSDFGKGAFRICFVGGLAHGKIAYAKDFEDANEKCSYIAMANIKA